MVVGPLFGTRAAEASNGGMKSEMLERAHAGERRRRHLPLQQCMRSGNGEPFRTQLATFLACDRCNARCAGSVSAAAT